MQLHFSGIPCKILRNQTQHSKTIIIDGHIIITGSANFTRASTTYVENCVFIYFDKKLAEQYKAFFNALWRSPQYHDISRHIAP
jgi:phosphatidylserine/phosphatidylglycerophosphate/cardiolipin synthase-like enzyme